MFGTFSQSRTGFPERGKERGNSWFNSYPAETPIDKVWSRPCEPPCHAPQRFQCESAIGPEFGTSG